MYKSLFISLILVFVFSMVNANSQDAYQIGEELNFKLYYNSTITGNVTAGEVTTVVKQHQGTSGSNSDLHIVLDGKTKGAFRWFFKADDSYETFIDGTTQLPFYFKQRLNEGSYFASDDVEFDQNFGKIRTINNKNNDIRNYSTSYKVQDLLSSLYYIRNWDLENLENNQVFNINLFMDDSVYAIDFMYQGNQTVETSLGKIDCMKFAPRVLTGGVFADETPMVIYVSNDKNRVPILAESELYIGRARMELTSHKNLLYPLKTE